MKEIFLLLITLLRDLVQVEKEGNKYRRMYNISFNSASPCAAPLSDRLTGVEVAGVTLLAAMLRFLPSTRPTAAELVVNSYFAALLESKPNASPASDCMRKYALFFCSGVFFFR